MNFAKNGVLYALFSLLLLFLPILIQEWSILPITFEQNLYRLPYFIFLLGLVLCWLFYNSREFNLLIILGVSFWSFQNYLWGVALSTSQKILLFDLLCVFIPVNFAIFNFLKERGILNQHGLKRLSFVAIQIAIITWLVVSNKLSISNILDVQLYPSYMSAIKQPALIIMVISLLVLITDWVIHMHPGADGAALGATSHRDFETLAGLVATLEGGVLFNVGSAVILPEVFLKALSLARNLGHRVRRFTTVDLDFIRHYRPALNVVERPTRLGGRGISLVGQHEILVPLLAAGLVERTEEA